MIQFVMVYLNGILLRPEDYRLTQEEGRLPEVTLIGLPPAPRDFVTVLAFYPLRCGAPTQEMFTFDYTKEGQSFVLGC